MIQVLTKKFFVGKIVAADKLSPTAPPDGIGKCPSPKNRLSKEKIVADEMLLLWVTVETGGS